MSAGGQLISDVGEFGLITRIDAALDGHSAAGVHVGIGDDASATGGMGLQSMAYRAQNLNGSVSVRRLHGGGTQVLASIPQPEA